MVDANNLSECAMQNIKIISTRIMNASASNDNSSSVLLVKQNNLSFIFGVINFPISATAFIGSLLCLALLWKTKTKLQYSTKAVFVSLSVSTICFGASTLYQGYNVAVKDPKKSEFCTFIGFFTTLSNDTAMVCQAGIAFNRFLSVILQARFRWVNSRYCGLLVAVIPWILSFIVCVFPIFHLGGSYGFNQLTGQCGGFSVAQITYTRFYRVFFPGGALLCIVLCNGAVVTKLCKSKQRLFRHQLVTKHSGTESVPAPSTNQGSMENRVTVAVLVTCAIFSVCCIPQMIHGFVASSYGELKGPLGRSLVTLYMLGIALGPWITTGIGAHLLKDAYIRARKQRRVLPKARKRLEVQNSIFHDHPRSRVVTENLEHQSVKRRTSDGETSL